MNHQDKFWQAFRDKVEDYSGSEYNSAEWAAMEQMLDTGGTTATGASAASTPKPWWAFWQLWMGVLILSGIAFWALATTDLNYNTSATESKETEAELPISNENVLEEQQLTTAVVPNLDQNETVNEQLLERQRALTENPAQEASGSSSSTRTVFTEASASTDQTEASSSTTALSNATEQTTLAEAPAANLSEPATEAVKENLPLALPTEAEQEEAQQMATEQSSAANPVPTPEQQLEPAQERLYYAPVAPLAGMDVGFLENAASESGLPIECPPITTNKNSRWRPSLILGGSAIPTNAGKGRLAYGPMIGISLQHQLNRKWALELEVVARLVGNYGLELSAADTFVNLSGQTIFHNESRRLTEYRSLEVPLVVRYRTSNAWTILGGLRYSHLKPTAIGRSRNSNGQIDAVSERVNQPLIWQHDYGILLGLEYRLGPTWALQMRYTQGMRDLSPDDLYQSTETHLNGDLQITARKKF